MEVIASSWTALDDEERFIAEREAKLLAVPTIAPSNSVAAIEAREIRDHWRTMSLSERTAALATIDREAGHEKLMLALMRSPVAQADHEVKAVREVWNRTQRLSNPGEALSIEQGRANIAHARLCLAHAAGIAKRITGFDGNKVLSKLLASQNAHAQRGIAAFGVTPQDAARERRNMAARAGQRID